jgi:hypothetical protein
VVPRKVPVSRAVAVKCRLQVIPTAAERDNGMFIAGPHRGPVSPLLEAVADARVRPVTPGDRV